MIYMTATGSSATNLHLLNGRHLKPIKQQERGTEFSVGGVTKKLLIMKNLEQPTHQVHRQWWIMQVQQGRDFDKQPGTVGAPTAQGKSDRLREPRLRGSGGGTGSSELNQKNLNSLSRADQQSPPGQKTRRASRTPQGWDLRTLPGPGRLLEPGSGRLPALSPWKRPPRRDQKSRRAKGVPGATRGLLPQPTVPPAPHGPPTRMQAATTWAAGAKRLFPGRASPLPASISWVSSTNTRAATGVPPSPSSVPPQRKWRRAAQVYSPTGEELLRLAEASACPSAAAPPPSQTCAIEHGWARAGDVRACTRLRAPGEAPPGDQPWEFLWLGGLVCRTQ